MSEPAPLIEFSFKDPERYPHPYPAREGLPSWLGALPPAVSGPGGSLLPTMSGDPGLVAGTSAGYIIPVVHDCEFTRDERGNVSYKSQGMPIGTQNPIQYAGAWFEKMVIIKFWNPWVIKTPPGYCTLVLPAVNRFEIPFEPLSGVIETDSYYLEVFFPTLCLMKRGQTVTLKKGTPLVQVIPVPREPWKSMVGQLDVARPDTFWTSTGR